MYTESDINSSTRVLCPLIYNESDVTSSVVDSVGPLIWCGVSTVKALFPHLIPDCWFGLLWRFSRWDYVSFWGLLVEVSCLGADLMMEFSIFRFLVRGQGVFTGLIRIPEAVLSITVVSLMLSPKYKCIIAVLSCAISNLWTMHYCVSIVGVVCVEVVILDGYA